MMLKRRTGMWVDGFELFKRKRKGIRGREIGVVIMVVHIWRRGEFMDAEKRTRRRRMVKAKGWMEVEKG